jgi:LPXTG-motif cell wall-anchored protein
LLDARDRAIGSVVLGLTSLALAAASLVAAEPECGMSKRYLCRLVYAVTDGFGISTGSAEASLLGAIGLALIGLGAVYWRAG